MGPHFEHGAKEDDDGCSSGSCNSGVSESTGSGGRPFEPVTRRMTVFEDPDAMKKKIQQNLLRPKYDVSDFYYKTGVFQMIARHKLFEMITLGVIAFNALWISIDTDLNDATSLLEAEPIFQIVEHAFCAYFFFEWIVRFMSFRRKRNGLRDGWFVFDSMLVSTMVGETWLMTGIILAMGGGGGMGGNAAVLRLLRLLRLSRMARMARLLRAMPELMILIKGMVSAVRSVFFVAVLLLLVMYVFAIVFKQLSDGTVFGARFFPSIPHAMHTLWKDGTLLDNPGETSRAISDESWLCWCLFFVFVTISALTIMNMLIGVLCEVIGAVAATEKESMTVSFVKEKMEGIMRTLDESNDGQISKEEFLKILDCEFAIKLLEDVGIDCVALVGLADIIFEPTSVDGLEAEKKLDFPEFMEVVLQLRGSNGATVKDIVDLRKYVRLQAVQTNNQVDSIVRHVHEQRHRQRKDYRSESGRPSPGSGRPCDRHGTGGLKEREVSKGKSFVSVKTEATESNTNFLETPAVCTDPEVSILSKFIGQDDSETSRRNGSKGSSGAGDKQTGGMFVDAEDMKEKVRQALLKPTYDVGNFYWKSGVFQFIARHKVFEMLTLAVIAFNALWIAIDTDHNNAAMLLDAQPLFQIVEHAFCGYFTFEWSVRFMAFRRKRDGLRDAWFVFDSMLVSTMVLETWVMTGILLAIGGAGGGMGNASILRLLRLLRLSRMARMAKLLRAMPELMILIKGMVSAMRSVFFVAVLLTIVMYVFAIVFKQLSADTIFGQMYFKTVPHAMQTLWIDGTLLDSVGSVSDKIAEESWICWVIFFAFVVLAAFTIMNMLIGVLCEVISAVATIERETMLVTFVKEKMQKIMSSLDETGDGVISKAEFVKILDLEEAVEALQEVEVDVMGLVDLADFIFNDDSTGEEKELDFADFMEVILSIRGSNAATVKDIMDLRKFVQKQNLQIHDKLVKLEKLVLESCETATDRAINLPQDVLKRTNRSISLPSKSHHSKDSLAPSDRLHGHTSDALQAAVDPEKMREWMAILEKSLKARWSDLQKMLLSLPNITLKETPPEITTDFEQGPTMLPGNATGEPEPENHPQRPSGLLPRLPGLPDGFPDGRGTSSVHEVDLRARLGKLVESLAVGLGDVQKVRETLLVKSCPETPEEVSRRAQGQPIW